MGDQLVTAADHLQLARLVTEISWRIDHGQANTVHELFVDDGTMTLDPTTLSGREHIPEWGRHRASATYRTRHVCTNMRFVADSDDAAEGTTVITRYRGEDDGTGTTLPRIVGEDHDRFVRTDHGWRFAARHWHQLFIS